MDERERLAVMDWGPPPRTGSSIEERSGALEAILDVELATGDGEAVRETWRSLTGDPTGGNTLAELADPHRRFDTERRDAAGSNNNGDRRNRPDR